MKKWSGLGLLLMVLLFSCKENKIDIYKKWQLENILLSQNTPKETRDRFNAKLAETKDNTFLTYKKDSTYTLTTVDTTLNGKFILHKDNKNFTITDQNGIIQDYKIIELTATKYVYQTNDPYAEPVTFVFKKAN